MARADLPEKHGTGTLTSAGAGRPDKAYDADALVMKRRGIKPVIPPKSNRKKAPTTASAVRERNCIERELSCFKKSRYRLTDTTSSPRPSGGMLFLAICS